MENHFLVPLGIGPDAIDALITAKAIVDASSDPAARRDNIRKRHGNRLTFGELVLVMRETTERPEGVETGTARLVGAETGNIVQEIFRLLDDDECYSSMSRSHNLFGDERSSECIGKVLLNV